MISEGCEQCAKGGKMVMFVYGYCDQRDCFYCPLGENRKNVTDVYANERQVETDEDVLEEAHRMDALGTSITGGEPQEALERTCHYLELLKDEFGEDHHTHLYTGIPGGRENMRKLSEPASTKFGSTRPSSSGATSMAPSGRRFCTSLARKA